MYLTFLLLRYIIDRHLEYVRMGGICSGIEVAITRTIRNRLTVDPVRGFESHPLRHVGASCISLAPTFSKVRARSLRCSSFPNRTRFAGLRFGFGRSLERKSILPTYCKTRRNFNIPAGFHNYFSELSTLDMQEHMYCNKHRRKPNHDLVSTTKY